MNDPANYNIEAMYVEFADEIEKFTEKKIQERFQRLLESAHSFIQGMGYNDHVVCNETLLMYAVLGYFSDINRLKEFHKINRVNAIKKLAYETVWLLKRKPLQVKDTNDQKYAFCNEQFAFSQITFWLSQNDEENSTEILAFKDLKFFSDSLFYHLKYRNYDPQVLELAFVSFMAGRKYQELLPTNKEIESKQNVNKIKKGKFKEIFDILFNRR